MYPGGRDRVKKWGRLLNRRREVRLRHGGGGAASAMKDASHALGGLMGRGWGALGRGAFLLK